MTKRLVYFVLGCAGIGFLALRCSAGEPQIREMSGYLLVDTQHVAEEFNAGFSLYSAAWPLVGTYPGHDFQSGLFGTWMDAKLDRKPPGDLYSDIEGGLGWWRATRFPTETPKFMMGGVAVNFSDIANGPSAGAGDWNDPHGIYGVAQLSPWLLFPLDGLNLKRGTCGQLFGYGYLPLPLTSAKPITNGKNLPTGDNCWTLFLNTKNFKGPVSFFTPYFWSHFAESDPRYSGLLLDSCPSNANKAFQMETQYIPAAVAKDKDGETYARLVDPVSFPMMPDGRSIVLHRLTSYNKKALWDGVKAWFDGGPAVSGQINPAGAGVQLFGNGGDSTWTIQAEDSKDKQNPEMDWKSYAVLGALDPTSYGIKWNPDGVQRVHSPAGGRAVLPEYFHLVTQDGKRHWVVINAADVPASTGLATLKYSTPREDPQEPYIAPMTPGSPYMKPGPVAGPFKAHLGDGTVVTYYWYRFADQPAMLHADLTPEEREAMQKKVEKLHRLWKKDREYLAPPTVGELAQLDPAEIVTPPKGFEVGYVPIATRQELEVAPSR